MTAWVVIAAVAAGSYALRVSMFLIVGRWTLPAWTARPMTLVGAAAVAALVAALVLVDGGGARVPEPATAAAVAAGFLAVRRTGNVMHAFAAGLPVYWVVSLIA